MAVFDAVICKHLFSDFTRYGTYTRFVKWDIFILWCAQLLSG